MSFDDKKPDYEHTGLTQEENADSRANEIDVEFPLLTTDTYSPARRLKHKKIKKESQKENYETNTLVVKREPDRYSTDEKTVRDSDLGRAGVGLDRPEIRFTGFFLAMLEALLLLKKGGTLIERYVFEGEKKEGGEGKDLEPIVYDYDEILETEDAEYIFVRITLGNKFFYLLSFNDSVKETRDVIFFHGSEPGKTNVNDLIKIFFYLRPMARTPKTFNISGYTLSRINHTYKNPEDIMNKIKRKLSLMAI